ncbi:hypothetical protein HFO56_39540 [Rhizobium laguerreae]|uniref:glyoxalase superfamily protein n=1 Tax=Rhizobium laguerreae TaxID=1076926 RepID=UPI001C90DE02|nr:glyoxalase superfamily protein [Rhizobium laguerreae]MBY3158395.1 hypothetical protein [Rhizobium laguerreae]
MTTNSEAAVDGSPKRRARAVQAKLKELGSSVSLGQAYEVMAVANGFRNWATMNAAFQAVPSPKSASGPAAVLPPKQPHLRSLIGYNSNPVDGTCAIHASADDYRNHFSVLGEDDGRLPVMLGLSECVLQAGGGLVFVDHSVDRIGELMIRKLAEKMFRSDDIVVIDTNGHNGVGYSPFTDLDTVIGTAHIVQSLMARFDATRSAPFEPVLGDDQSEAVWMIIEAARFAALRDQRPLDIESIIGMADAARFHAVAHETRSVGGSVAYRMPLSLRDQMRSYCSSFGGAGSVPSEMVEAHRSLVADLKAILPPVASVTDDPWNIHRLIRERKIGIVRVDPRRAGYDRLLNTVISEIELAMTEMSILQALKETKSVIVLDGFKSELLAGVHQRLAAARWRNIVIMSNAIPPERKANIAMVKDSERLRIEMAWAREPDHPNAFEVLDPRIRFLEYGRQPNFSNGSASQPND